MKPQTWQAMTDDELWSGDAFLRGRDKSREVPGYSKIGYLN